MNTKLDHYFGAAVDAKAPDGGTPPTPRIFRWGVRRASGNPYHISEQNI